MNLNGGTMYLLRFQRDKISQDQHSFLKVSRRFFQERNEQLLFLCYEKSQIFLRYERKAGVVLPKVVLRLHHLSFKLHFIVSRKFSTET